jgi:predicted Zn-dependent protease
MTGQISIRSMLAIGLMAMIALSWGNASGQTDNIIFQAMQDELQRSMSQLVMEGLERPYFIGYTIDDYQNLTVSGSLGTLTQSRLDRGRFLTVDFRVGDYGLDNSDFVAGYYDPGPSYYSLAVDDNYDAIRNGVYLATDEMYKEALKEISRKRAYLQTRVIKDRPDDFLYQPANIYNGIPEAFDSDQPRIEQLVVAATQAFTDYPEIASAEIKIRAGIDNQYFVNSGGSRSLRGDRIYVVELSMSGRTDEGEDITYGDRMIVKDLRDLPDKEKLSAWARSDAEKIRKILDAETVEEYTGPVIFTGDAAGEFFRQLFVKNVAESPAPLYEREELAKRSSGPELANKINRRVLPEFINVYDDPTTKNLGPIKLVGDFPVDDAGNPPKRIQLVDKGKLVSLPIGVSPTKQVKDPNGHARGAVSKEVRAEPGNIIIESDDKSTFDQLKRLMIQMCRDMGLDYGLVIKKLDNPEGKTSRMMFFYGPQSGKENALSVPLEAYKVKVDGTQEPLRSLEFSGVTVRVLKDILQTDDTMYGYNYLVKNDDEIPVSIVCPSILVEEMELKKTEAKTQKPRVLPSPLARK